MKTLEVSRCHDYIRDNPMELHIRASITVLFKMTQQNVTRGHGNTISILT